MDIFKSNLLNQKGQALLIVVLVMVVALTVTLSLVSRSVVDLKTSTDQADSQRALAAAEAGAEQVIKTNASIGVGSNKKLDTTNYSANITQVAGSAQFLVNGGNLIAKNEGAYIWLSTPTYNAANSFLDSWSGSLTIYWGEDSSNPCNNAALEVVVLSGTKLSPILTRYAFDPCSDRANNAASGNHFTLVSASAKTTVGTKSFYYQKTIISITNGFLVNVNPIYYSSYIGASGTNLPSQGSIITSSGTSGGSSSVSRKITVFQGYPQLPAELFPYSILSP